MKAFKFLLAGTLALSLSACMGSTGPKQQVGTLLGAAAGAVTGAQVGKGRGKLAATAAGTLLGAFAGSEIGKSLDRADMAYLHRTQQRALETAPSGSSTSWTNPDSGNAGRVTPQRTYRNASGAYCREFQQTVTVGGNTETAYGTACRQPDGTWKIVKGTPLAEARSRSDTARQTPSFPSPVSRGQERKSYGEVSFPLGDLSFADEVVSFTSGVPGARAKRHRTPEAALGIPDYDGVRGNKYLSLGCGGVLVVKFTDNSLIDIDGPDLHVFEIGPAVEPTHLAISRDGERWIEIGRVAGGRADIDIAEFVDRSETYSHVRLTSGHTTCGGPYPGADIDAVGAIGSAIKMQLDSMVLFGSGKAAPRLEAEAELAKIADLIRERAGARVVIEGHTDNLGPDETNQALSERRAAAVQSYLAAAGGMESITFVSRGHGEKRPVASNRTAEGRQLNRRVEITVIPQ